VKLFEADTKRQPYVPGHPSFVVSPLNARKQLSAFLRDAKKELLIYDPEIGDPAMLRLIEARAQAGVNVKVIGRARSSAKIEVRKLTTMRLHTRTIIRDGAQAFIGSQSLREIELGSRREVGIIFRDKKIVAAVAKIFRDDWDAIERAAQQPVQEATPADSARDEAEQLAKVAKKVAKAITKDLPPVAPVLRVVVRELAGENGHGNLGTTIVEGRVEDAVKEAVKEAVRSAVETVVEENGAPTNN
jgi:cardiolipin synthase A/B